MKKAIFSFIAIIAVSCVMVSCNGKTASTANVNDTDSVATVDTTIVDSIVSDTACVE